MRNNSNFIKFIEGEKRFINSYDLIDLYEEDSRIKENLLMDVDSTNDAERALIYKAKEIKSTINNDSYGLYAYRDTSNEEYDLIVNYKDNIIVIDNYNISSILYYIMNENISLVDLRKAKFKKNLNGWKIVLLRNTEKEFKTYSSRKLHSYIEKEKQSILNTHKETFHIYKNKLRTNEDLFADVQEYILKQSEIQLDETTIFDIVNKNNSIRSKGERFLFTMEYVTNKEQILNNVIIELEKILNGEDNYCKAHLSTILAEYLSFHDYFKENKNKIENMEHIKSLKNIINALEQCGKTTIINDIKYENSYSMKRDKNNHIYLSIGGCFDKIASHDIKNIKFRGKLLYEA